MSIVKEFKTIDEINDYLSKAEGVLTIWSLIPVMTSISPHDGTQRCNYIVVFE